MDIRQSPLWAKYITNLGWQAEKFDGNFFYIKKLPLFGTIIKLQRPSQKINLKKVIQFVRNKNALFLKIEPKTDSELFLKHGFHKDSWPLCPPKTIIIDLSPSQNQIYNSFSKKTRYSIRQAKKNKVEIFESTNGELFSELWTKNRERLFGSKTEVDTLFKIFSQNKRAKILFGKGKKEILCGVMLIFFDRTSYYIYAFSTPSGRALQAPSLCAYESIKYAKSQGSKNFDFEGIYDGRFHSATKSWQGFSHFKKGFGGVEIEYTGSYSKYFFPKFW